MKPLTRFLVILFFSCSVPASAQWYVGVKFMGLSFHPGSNPNKAHYVTAISKNKKFVMNFGVALTVEYMFYKNFSVKYDQAVFGDCAGKFAGMSMLNLRYTVSLGKLGYGSAGIGPFFFYRRSWTSFGDYVDEGYFHLSKNEKWQTKFVWYGGELEHDYPLGDGWDVSTNLFPGYPVVYAVTPGVRYKLK